MKLLVLFFSIFCAYLAHASTFIPLSIEQQVEESNKAAEVILQSKRTFQNSMGMIFTEYAFAVEEGFQLDSGDFQGEHLVITMLGGTINGLTSFIEGAPTFKENERAFLLLKKIDSQMYISNFSLGKYRILVVDGETYYESTVFPHDPKIGRVKKEKMLELLKVKSEKESRKDSSVFNAQEKIMQLEAITENDLAVKKRNPAMSNEEKKEIDMAMLSLGIAFLVCSLIGIYSLTKIKD